MVSVSTETATKGARTPGKRGRPAKGDRKPMREPQRQELRAGQVLGRDGEVLSRRRSTGFSNPFDVPAHLREDGWDYQWVRTSCHGKPDPANMSDHHENGWRPVADAKTLAHYGVSDAKHIERDGLVLCERRVELTEQALAEDRRNALELRRTQAEQFGARDLPDGFEDGRKSGDGRFDASKKVKRTLEGAPASLLPKREFDVDADD